MAWISDQAGQTGTGLVRVPPFWRLGLRAVASLALAALFLWALAERITQIDTAALGLAFGQIAPAQWVVALGFTALSFCAVGHYDEVVHRHFATGFLPRHSRRAGICAIAVSQTLGLGLISGTIMRWRMLPGITFWQSTRLTAAVAISFLAGWAVVTVSTLLVLPTAPFKSAAALVLLAALSGACLALISPHWGFRWPNAFTLARLVALCAVDSLAAAAALHALFPAELTLPFSTLLPAFLLALGAGLALGTPGGMGAFEMTLLAMLPSVPEPPVLAALLGWRLVYYVMPAMVAALIALKGPTRADKIAAPGKSLPEPVRAETGLTIQGMLKLERPAAQPWLVGRSGHCLIALLDPQGASDAACHRRAISGLEAMAKAESRLPVIYKASARLAALARRQGNICRRIGWEAWLSPPTFRLAASSRAGLRRKLRRAEAAGIDIRLCTAETTPWQALDQIARAWSAQHGGERGFSMGRFSQPYISQQRLYVAWQGIHPIAFASFHTCGREWSLDLMRHGAAVPDGTMYALITAAIADADSLGITRFSLAAVPDGHLGQSDWISKLVATFAPETANTGLLRFKAAFAPQWSALYLVAPNRAALALAGLSLWRAIARPPPLMPEIERDHEEYEFASGAAPWHIECNR